MFYVRPEQVLGMPDLDNLMVPVAEESRNLGWFSRGFTTLDRLQLQKTHAKNQLGAEIRIRPAGGEADEAYQVSFSGRVREGDSASSEAVESAVRCYMQGRAIDPLPSDEPVRLVIRYRQRRPTSLVGMLKSTIDGLEPLLGRSPGANPQHRFHPADERVIEIVAVRVSGEADEVELGWSLGEAAIRPERGA